MISLSLPQFIGQSHITQNGIRPDAQYPVNVDLNQLVSKINTLNKRIDAQLKFIQELELKLKLSDEINQANNQLVQTYQKQLNTAQKKVDSLEAELTIKNGENDFLLKELEAAKAIIDRVRSLRPFANYAKNVVQNFPVTSWNAWNAWNSLQVVLVNLPP